MADTVRTQQELLGRMKINVAGVQVGRRADINVQTFRDFVVSIPTLGTPGVMNPFVAADFCASNANGPCMQNEAASATNPTFVPDKTDRDTGLGSVANTSLNAIVNGSSKMQWGTSITVFAQAMAAAASGGPQVRNNTATVTGPVFNPHSSLPNSGMGGDASGNVSMITNALERMRFSNAGLITFFQNLAANIATGPLLKNEVASDTNPTLVPDRAKPTTGIGSGSGNSLALISASTQVLRLAGVTNGVNSYTFSSAVAGLPGRMVAQGPDTNIDTYLASKGTGVIGFHPGNGTRELFIDTDGLKSQLAAGPAFLNVLPSASVPSLVPDRSVPTTGIGKSGSSLDLIAAGEARLRIGTGPGNPNVVFQPINTSGLFIGSVSGSFGLHNVASSATVPSLLNSFLSEVAGIGGIAGACTMIAASLERITVNATGIGFFATTPAARPTGVAVTAAGIHAALVTLGLITA